MLGAIPDFFGTRVIETAMTPGMTDLSVEMTARVDRDPAEAWLDVPPALPALRAEIDSHCVLDAVSPHHFLAPSPHMPDSAEIVAFARDCAARAATVGKAIRQFGETLHHNIVFDDWAWRPGRRCRRVPANDPSGRVAEAGRRGCHACLLAGFGRAQDRPDGLRSDDLLFRCRGSHRHRPRPRPWRCRTGDRLVAHCGETQSGSHRVELRALAPVGRRARSYSAGSSRRWRSQRNRWITGQRRTETPAASTRRPTTGPF